MSTSSEPKYGSVEAVPVSGAGQHSDADKRDALDSAATRVELDLNGGNVIEEPDDTINLAANTLATYYLARGLVDPNSARGGDLSDDGSRRSEFANQFLEEYNSLVAQIQESDTDDDAVPDTDTEGDWWFETL